MTVGGGRLADTRVRDRLSRAGGSAFWIAAAEITFDHLAAVRIVIHCAKWTGQGANFAANAGRIRNHFRAGFSVNRNCTGWASGHAPSFGALGAGIWNLAAFIVEVEYLYARFSRIEGVFAFVRTGKFALQATSTFFRINVKRLSHTPPPILLGRS